MALPPGVDHPCSTCAPQVAYTSHRDFVCVVIKAERTVVVVLTCAQQSKDAAQSCLIEMFRFHNQYFMFAANIMYSLVFVNKKLQTMSGRSEIGSIIGSYISLPLPSDTGFPVADNFVCFDILPRLLQSTQSC